MPDIYDRLLGSTAMTPQASPQQTGRDAYDTILDNEQTQANQRMRTVLGLAAKANPDQAARAQQIARQTGMPVPTVERNLLEMETRQKASEAAAAAAYSPILRQQFQNPDFAKVAHDDAPRLSAIERGANFFKGVGKSLYAGTLDVSAGLYGIARAGSEVLDVAGQGISDTQNYVMTNVFGQPVQQPQGPAAFAGKNSLLTQFFTRAQQETEAYANRLTPQGEGPISAGFYSGLRSIPGSAGALAAAFATRNPEVATRFMAAPVAGQAYGQARDKGVDIVPALNFAASQGVIEYATEKLPVGQFLGDAAKQTGVVKMIRNQLLHEIPGEQVATILQDLNEWAVINPEKPFSEYIKERPNAALATAVATVVGTGGNIAIVNTTQWVANKLAGKVSEAENALNNGQLLGQLAEAAANSKLRERDPIAFQQFVERAVANAPVQDVYIDARTFAQSLTDAGLDPAQVAQTIPAVREQLGAALATGVDLKIPLAEFATHMAGQEYLPAMIGEMKTDPFGPTYAQASRPIEEQLAEFQAEADKVYEAKAADQEFKLSADAVKAEISRQLTETGRFTKDVNEQYATLHSSFAAVMAAKLGITPEQFFQKYMLKVQAEPVTGGRVMDQIGSPAFNAWFRSSKIVDAQGKPLMVFHGTTKEFSEFTKGSGTNGQLWGAGFYLTPDAKYANSFAKDFTKPPADESTGGNVIPAYVSLQNPLTDAQELSDIKQSVNGDPEAMTAEMQARGYDGVNVSIGGRPIIVAFEPTQIKSAIGNNGEYSSSNPNILFQGGVEAYTRRTPAETGEQTGLALVNNLASAAAFARDNRFANGRDFKMALQERALAEGVDLSGFDEETARRLADYVFEDALEAVQDNQNAIGWYDRAVKDAKAELAKLYPEIATDPEAEFAFIWALAVTSNGLKVDKNFELAANAYEAWKANGAFPTDIGIGQAAQGINDGLALYDVLVTKLGSWKAARDFMVNRQTVKDIEAATGIPISGEGKNETVRGAAILGPKIGNGFFSNLYGHFDALTMDRWLMRTVGRWRGTLIARNEKMEIQKRDEIRALAATLTPAEAKFLNGFFKGSDAKIGKRMTDAQVDRLAEEVAKRSTAPDWRSNINQAAGGENLRKLGNALAKYLDGQVEAPGGTKERAFLRDVFGRGLDRLQAQPGMNQLTMADLQALLWYPEKLLYESAKKPAGKEVRGYEDDEAPDYANAARKLVAARLGQAGQPGDGSVAGGPGLGDQPGTGQEGTYAQSGVANRGQIAFGDDITSSPSVITLLRNADLSTFLHESGHFFLEVTADVAAQPDAPAEIQQDMQTLLGWFGVSDLAAWQALDTEAKRPFHEQFARGFEAFLFEGKAPSLELQSVFQRFAAWLKNVYRSLTQLNVELTDEVRSVMGRMLATTEQIQTAEEARNMKPLFATADDAGMTADQWAEYQAQEIEATQNAIDALQARSMRDMQWLGNAKSRVLRELQRDAAEKRKAVRAEVTTEVMAEPVNRARQLLKRGLLPDGSQVEGPHRLSLPALREMYPEGKGVDYTKLGYGGFGMLAEDGLAPDVVAEMLGCQSGDALVRELLSAEPASDKIEAITDQRMLERYGDLADPDSIARAADEAIHNDARIRFIATELSALNTLTKRRRVTIDAIKAYVSGMVANKKLRDLKPNEFTSAAAKAGKASDQALKKGDTLEAASQKQNQLVNTMSAKEAMKAAGEAEKILGRFRKIAGGNDAQRAKTRNMDLVNAARAVLAAYGIGLKSKSPAEYMEAVKAYDPTLYDTLAPMLADAQTNGKDIRDLTVAELRALSDTVESLWFLSRRERQMEIDGKLIDRKEATDDLSARLEELGVPARVPGEGQAVTEGEKRVRMLLGAKAALRRVESWVSRMDGADSGAFRKYIWTPISEAADRFRADKGKYLTQYRDLLKAIEPSLRPGRIAAPEIDYTFGYSKGDAGMAELLHAILHTGNDSNKRKLLLGRGWATENEDGTLDTTQWDAFINRMIGEGRLEAVHFDFAQGVWDLLESMKPLAQKTHREVFGRYFNEVTAQPFENSLGAWRGGYVPAVCDTFEVQDAAINAELERINEGNGYMFPATNRGFTKSRVEYNRPLALDLRMFSGHISKVLLFSHMERQVRDAQSLLKAKGFSGKLTRYDPVAYTDMLLPWLNRAAKQTVETPTQGWGGKMADQFFRTARTRAGMSAMFANLVNAFQQVTGFSMTAVKVPASYLAPALYRYVRAPNEIADQVAELSPFMADRLNNQAMRMGEEIDDMLLNPSKYEQAQAWTRKHGYFLQSAFQNFVDVISWSAAYDQAVTRGDTDAEAVRYANSVVRETQGSLSPEDISRMEAGSAFTRLFTQFSGYFNMQANLLGTEFAKVRQDVGVKKGAGRLMYVAMLGFLVPAWASELIVQAFRGGWDDDDHDGYWDEFLAFFFGAPLRAASAMVPVAGQLANVAVNSFNSKPYDDRISTSPAISMLESAGSAPHSVWKAASGDGSAKKAIRDTLTLLAVTTGIPVSALGRPLGYAADVAEGKVTPSGPIDATRGLVTGTASPGTKQ